MSKPQFVYVIYIGSTVDRVWNALIDPEMTREYWRHRNLSDWKTGSRWMHQRADDSGINDVVGTVIESSAPHRLVVSWVPPADEGNANRTSRVTYEIEPFMDSVVRLTVTHEELDSEMLQSVSFGWPLVMSALKSLLETGKIGRSAA
jgi:uncharacterized protein YndB with AHSA1/START domain